MLEFLLAEMKTSRKGEGFYERVHFSGASAKGTAAGPAV